MDENKNKLLQDIEQSSELMAENFPACWRRMYLNLLAEGFGEEQSMRILLSFVHAICGGRLAN